MILCFVLLLLLHVDLFVTQNSSSLIGLRLNVGIIENEPLIYKNKASNDEDDYIGILFDIWKESTSQLNVSFNYGNFNYSNKSDIELNDVILYQVTDSTSDESRTVTLIDESLLGNYWKSTEIVKETYYIFFPSMLAILIQGVIWELFFFVVIILIPWILIHAQIFYVFDARNYKDLTYFKGIVKSIRRMLGKESSGKARCGQIYPYIFYSTTSIIMMLILGDFIYIVANMLTKYDISNVYDIVNNKVNICAYKEDFFVTSNLKQFREISLMEKKDLQDCFKQLSSLESHVFLISEYYVRHFFRIEDNQKYNNRFGYYLKQNSYKKYQFLFKKTISIDLYKSLTDNITQLRNKDEFDSILKEYLEFIRYDKLPASSILSDSTILIFSSLTVTSIFLILFLVFTIRSRLNRVGRKGKHSNIKLGKSSLIETSQVRDQPTAFCGTPFYPRSGQQGVAPINAIYSEANQRAKAKDKLRGEPPGNINQYGKKKAPLNRSLSLTGGVMNFKYEGKPEKSLAEIEAISSKDENNRIRADFKLEKHISSVSRINSEGLQPSEISIFQEDIEKT